MSRCAALYSNATGESFPRTTIELSGDALLLTRPDGRWRKLILHGCRFQSLDAACQQRFVRQLILEWRVPYPGQRVDLITPPDRGTIAPRAAGLPGVPDDAAVIESSAWDTLASWLAGGGRPAGHTIAELARLACIATPHFAQALGKLAARAVMEMSWDVSVGPMRASGGPHNPLGPLEEAARNNQRAAVALRAAKAAISSSRWSRQRR